MREIIEADQPFVRAELSADEALEVFADQPYKGEIIERVSDAAAAPTSVDAGEVAGGETISVYRNTRRVRRPLPRPARAVHRSRSATSS